MRQRLTGRTAIAIYILAAGILAGNFMTLTGIFQNDPSLHRSGLAPAGRPNLFPGDSTIDPNDGFTSQALGHLAAEEWLHGHIPYWNHYEGLGTPLAGEMQAAALFPLVVLLALPRGLLYMHVLLQLIAGVSTLLVLKRLGRSDVAATLGGLVFALNGTFAWLTNAIFTPIAFLPLLVLSVETIRGRAREGVPFGWTLMAAALALSIYAGFPEVAYIDALFVGGWALVRLIQLHGVERLVFLGKLIAGTTVGLALAAPIMVAFLDYLVHTNAGGHFHGIGEAALPSLGVFSLIIPYVYGPIWGFQSFDLSGRLTALWGGVGGFLTATAFGLALMAIWSRRQRGLKLFLMLWAFLVALKTYGFRPVAWIFNLVPGITSTAFYRYATVSVEFAVIVLAAFAIDDLLQGRLGRQIIAVTGLVALLVVTYCGVEASAVVRVLVGAPHHTAWAAVSVAWAIGTLLVVFGAGFLRSRLRTCLLVGVVAVDALGMFVVPQFSTAHPAPLHLGPVRFLQAHLGSQRFFGLGPIQPNYGSYFRLASINVNDAILPKAWVAYITTNLNEHANPLSFIGVDPANLQGATSSTEFVDRLASYAAVGVIYVLEDRGRIPPDVVATHGLTSVYVDPLFEILQLPQPAPYWHAGDGAHCLIGKEDVTHVEVSCGAGGSLIRLEQYMPGWAAVVNGHPVPVRQSGDLFQKIPLPAGKSRIVFTYTPPYIDTAWGLCLLALVVAVGSAVIARRARPNLRS